MQQYFRYAAFAAAGFMAACGDMQSKPEDALAGAAPAGPVVLGPVRTAESGGAGYAGSLDRAELAKAIERYRITKKRGQSPVETGAADLNGDGKPEAAVLFTGPDWCSKTGCSLVIFQLEQFGYRPVSHIVSANAPVLAAASSGAGWRDLIVKAGGGGAPVRDVRVPFGMNGYAANALLQPAADAASIAQAAKMIEDNAAYASGAAPADVARNP